jgi:hypothetical protein
LCLDVLLGAFVAGIVVRLLVRGQDSPIVDDKLEAIGYGFLVPIFFIVSGMQFHLTALTSRPIEFLRVPLFLIIRGTPAFLLYRRDLDKEETGPPGALLGYWSAFDRGDHNHRGSRKVARFRSTPPPWSWPA